MINKSDATGCLLCFVFQTTRIDSKHHCCLVDLQFSLSVSARERERERSANQMKERERKSK